MSKKYYITALVAICFLLAACGGTGNPAQDDAAGTPGGNGDISPVPDGGGGETPAAPENAPVPGNIDPGLTAADLVARMSVGWNLGNTFDASGAAGSRLTGEVTAAETAWLGGAGNQTTQTLIQAVKNAGFGTLRIPVSWAKAADPNDGWKIREDWLGRIKQVADWALEEDMFVIINMHHDNESLKLGIDGADSEDHPGRQFYVSIWTQVAEVFKDYDERLIFESLNEPRHEGGKDEWWGGTQEVRDNINALNQAFVDVIRASGGSNTHRILMVTPHAAGVTPNGLRDFVIPDDPLNDVNKFVMSIHTYAPFSWAHDGRGQYGGASGITGDLNTVAQAAERLGVPVILGEWGSNHASMGNDADQDLRNEQRPVHAGDYVREALERGMVPIWWDNGGFSGTEHTWGIIRRNPPHEISELHQQVIDAIMAAAGK